MKSDIPLPGLLSIISRNHFIYLNQETKDLDLTGGQFPCLITISHKPGTTQDHIAKKLQIDKGSIARAVKKLEDNELIHRIPDPKNRRKYLLFLTKKGENIIPQIKSIEEKWEKTVCEGLREDEVTTLMEFLNVLAENSTEKIKKQC
jgi:DNA-binding MarR family transcriptional regulator